MTSPEGMALSLGAIPWRQVIGYMLTMRWLTPVRTWWHNARRAAPLYHRLLWSPQSLPRVAAGVRTHGAVASGALATLAVLAMWIGPLTVREADPFINVTTYMLQCAGACVIMFFWLTLLAVAMVALAGVAAVILEAHRWMIPETQVSKIRMRMCALAPLPLVSIVLLASMAKAVVASRWPGVELPAGVDKPAWIDLGVFDLIASWQLQTLGAFTIAGIVTYGWFWCERQLGSDVGKCPSCGYPTVGLDCVACCPECGIETQRRIAA